MKAFVVFVVLLSVSVTTEACGRTERDRRPRPTEDYPRTAQLDTEGKYFLFWKSNDTHITFETHVRTRGYVGFGLSGTGNMYPADMVIGWVKDGHATLTDRYTDSGYYEPRIDDSQDWFLLEGYENDFGTVLKFVRKLDTCDDKQDIKIEKSTTRVIFSYHSEDPKMWTGLCYHGHKNRGSKSLYLLDSKPTMGKVPADSKTYDFVRDKTSVPAKETHYHCNIFKMPSESIKHHVVMFEPIIEKGNEDIVHHMILYACSADLEESLVGLEYSCFDQWSLYRKCEGSILLAWAVGGGPFFFPDHVGYPLGTPNSPNFFILETHFNNPSLSSGRLDSSGFRIHYTPSLRQHDAGMLFQGVEESRYQIIPPGYPKFMSQGYCSSTCTQQAFQNLPNGEIKAFAVLQHAHLLGKVIKTRHFRKDRELQPIALDSTYDFDFQEFRLLDQEVAIKAGDSVMVECEYDSRKRSKVTYGGWGTTDEMCQIFMLYYPLSNLTSCFSGPRYDEFNFPQNETGQAMLESMLEAKDWSNPDTRLNFQKTVDNSTFFEFCIINRKFQTKQGEIPRTSSPYVPPISSTCPQQ